MDKNIAAILREDARTVVCSFVLDSIVAEYVDEGIDGVQVAKYPGSANTGKLYTYVTDLKLARGDLVAVPVQGNVKLVRVIEVHDTAQIEPNSDIEYTWVISKVDVMPYALNLQRNKQIADTVAEATRTNMRSVFQNQVLGGLTGDSKAKMLTLLGVEK